MSTPTEYIRDIRTFVEDSRVKRAFHDDFEPALFKWSGAGAGSADWTVARVTNKALNGEASMLLQTATTTPATNDSAYASFFAPISFIPSVLEFSCFFTTRETVASQYLQFRLQLYSQQMNAAPNYIINWNGAAAVWEYHNLAGSYATTGLANISANSGYDAWNHIAFTVLPTQRQWLNLKINEQEFDMAGEGVQSVAPGANNNSLAIQIYNKTLTATQRSLWVDDITVVMI